MEKLSLREDCFEAGLGRDALDLPAAVGAEIEHALMLEEVGLQRAKALWARLLDRVLDLWSRLRT